jgi:NADH:ubiquinone oxidoreductase subunit C
VDTNALQSKLNRLVPGAILEKGRIGEPGLPLAWVDAKLLRKVAEGVRADKELAIDWLENLSVAQVDEALMVTYFFRSSSNNNSGNPGNSGAEFALRVTIIPAKPEAWIQLPSVRDLWPMAGFFESDASELFGIRFMQTDGTEIKMRPNLIPDSLREVIHGFPLRKSFDVASVPREDPESDAAFKRQERATDRTSSSNIGGEVL